MKWDVQGTVPRFGAIEMCLTIKEYARILGVHYDTDFVVSPLLNIGFKL